MPYLSGRSRWVLFLGAAVLAGGITWMVRRERPHSPAAGGDRSAIRNVLLISLDTTRADHLSCYGYSRPTTPNIDAVAAEGLLFRHAVTPVATTLPAHCTMLTGTNPPYHGVHMNHDAHLGDINVTMAEILKSEGFRTGAVVSVMVLDSEFGIAQGFDTYDDRFDDASRPTGMIERRGAEVSRAGKAWLQKHHRERFFLFLHYFDPHAPYEAPEPFASRFARDPYAGEIAYADHCVGQVIDKLKQLGVYDSTLIVITADHGEMLGEHGELTHSYFVYQGSIRVPLVMRLPGQRERRTFANVAGLIDIVPTVCGLLGISVPAQVRGRDLSAWFGSEAPPSRELYCESVTPMQFKANGLLGVIGDRWKYIQTSRPELYDLVSDPGETVNLAGERADLVEQLQGRLRGMLEDQTRTPDEAVQTDETTARALESLGYIAGSQTDRPFELDPDRLDPKDRLEYYKTFAQLVGVMDDGKYADARKLGAELLEQDDGVCIVHFRLGGLAKSQGQLAKTIHHMRRAVSLDPRFGRAHYRLAQALADHGETDEAIVSYRRALEVRPRYAQAHNNLAVILVRQQQEQEAIDHYRRALEIRPDYPQCHFNLANAMMRSGRAELGIHHYGLAVRYRPKFAMAHLYLGKALLDAGRTDEAIVRLREALRLKPDMTDARRLLAAAQRGGRQGQAP